VKFLREKYMQKKSRKVKTIAHRNIEKKFSSEWKKFSDELPPTTHEIDLIRASRDSNGEKIIEGFEVKYFKIARKSRRYTEGFGQSIGLLLWGFNEVTLIHVFDNEFDEEERKRFVRTTKELADRLELVTYRAFIARKVLETKLYQLKNDGSLTEKEPMLGRGTYPNRFLENMDNKRRKRRDFIEEIVGIIP
jgi:hypothetical protein